MTEYASDPFPADAPPPGTYALDPERTTIRADVKAMFGLITVHGTFRLQAGQVSIAADPGSSSVQASIEAGGGPEPGVSGLQPRVADLDFGWHGGPVRRHRPGDHPGIPVAARALAGEGDRRIRLSVEQRRRDDVGVPFRVA